MRRDKLGIADRKHFFTYAAKTMRNIVIDFARRRLAERHGGAAERVTLDSHLLGQGRQEASVIDVDNALLELEALDPALAKVVEMRYFGGYTEPRSPKRWRSDRPHRAPPLGQGARASARAASRP